jgi:hypothetical protein
MTPDQRSAAARAAMSNLARPLPPLSEIPGALAGGLTKAVVWTGRATVTVAQWTASAVRTLITSA